MFGRFALVAAALVAMGAPAALAGSPSPIWLLKKQCDDSPGTVKLCAFQFANGSRNWAVTKQKTELGLPSSSTVFSVTIQHGNDNAAYTRQEGKNLDATTIQYGDNNQSGIHQYGESLETTVEQHGDGIWSAASSQGNGVEVTVVSNGY